jgi:FAM192A/Fyv6, N-terminal domain
MSSGFVPAGSEDSSSRNDDDWLRAQHAIEVTRRQKREEGKQEGGKSLYEVLQQNKSKPRRCLESGYALVSSLLTCQGLFLISC